MHVRAAAVDEAVQLARDLPEQVMVIFQHPGDVVQVQAGWAHAVLNIEPNLMVSVEVVRAEEAALIATGHRLSVQYIKERNAGDYARQVAGCHSPTGGWFGSIYTLRCRDPPSLGGGGTYRRSQWD